METVGEPEIIIIPHEDDAPLVPREEPEPVRTPAVTPERETVPA